VASWRAEFWGTSPSVCRCWGPLAVVGRKCWRRGVSPSLILPAKRVLFEGGKLAAINRWEFDMETALDGAPQQQPIFAALGQEHRRQPWPLEALDALIDLARRQASASLPHEDSRREARYRKLATALVHALWNEVLPEVTVTLVATVLAASAGPAGEQRARWIARIRGLRPSSRWPRSHRRAFSFLRGAGLVLLRQDASEATQEGRQTPRLSLGSRLRLVFRALLA